MPVTWAIGPRPCAGAPTVVGALGAVRAAATGHSEGRGPAPASAPGLLLEELARQLAKPRAPRLAVELAEAAAALGVSKAFFDRHVRHELRLVRRGRKVLVPVRELERWLAENAARTLEGQP